ncbi:MAG: TIGR03619 family F420-dependent LLM class oxidoreductase [Hyphomicrobiaceae bacterium]
MKFGLHFGARGIVGDPDTLATVARRAEALGFEHFGVSDHVIVATEVESRYPYSATGKFFAQDTGHSVEQLTTLGFLAAATHRIRLLTSVMVLPHRHPVLTAKMLATLDVLSKGRLTLGVGVGWMAEEIELLGGPPFASRAKSSDEYIEAFYQLWSAEAPRKDGHFTSFKDLKFQPKPVQKPHPPIWIGGEVGAARRRAGRLGTGWYPVAANPNHPLDTPDLYAAGLGEVAQAAIAAGRHGQHIDAALLAIYCRVGKEMEGRATKRLTFTGSAQAIVDDIGAYRERGLEHFLIGGDGFDLNGTLDHLERFAGEVMAKLK